MKTLPVGLRLVALLFFAGVPSAVPSFAQAYAISGRILHLKADTGITQDGSGNVSAWADQSGNGHDMQQSSAGNKPTYQASGINSQPTVRFNGSSQFLTGTTTTALKPNNITIIAVYKLAGSNAWAPVVAQPYRSSGWTEPYYAWALGASYNTDGAPMLHTAIGGAWKTSRTGVATPTSTAVLVAATYDENTGSRLYINGDYQGGLKLSGPISYSTGNLFYLGRSPAGESLNGDIAEVVVYDRVLTAAELEAIGVYLQGKYAIPGIATPSAPASVAATAISDTQVAVRWQPGATTSSGTIFTVERKTGAGSYAVIAEIQGLDYLDTGLAASTGYTYRITARSYNGSSSGTESSSVTTLAVGPDVSLSGLVLWLEAAVGVSKDGSGNVGVWQDQSGNQHDLTQLTSGSKPTYQASSINSRPTVKFNGSSQFLTGTTTTALKPNNITIIAVYKLAGSNAWAPILSQPYRSSGWADPYYAWALGASYSTDGAPMLHTAIGGAWKTSRTDVATPTSTAVLVAATYDENTGSRIYINGDYHGGLKLSGPLSYNTGNLFYLGRSPATEAMNGEVAEILVYDRVLSATELEAAGIYLHAKYQLSGIATPSAPASVTASAVSATQVDVRWQPGATGSNGTLYTIERKTGAGSYAVIAEAAALDYLDTGLGAGTGYTYRITARSPAGSSSGTESSAVTTLASGPDIPFTGLRLWLKADGGVATDASGNIGLWQDQSGNRHDVTQFTTASKPTYEAAGINSRPTVKFTGSKSLSGTSAAALKPENLTVLAVYRVAAVSSYSALVSHPYNAAWGSPYFAWELGASTATDGAPVLHSNIGGTWFTTSSDAVTPLNTATLALASHDKEAGTRIYVNGAIRGMRNLGGPLAYGTATLFSVGSDLNNPGFNGQIAEIMVYDRVLAAGEREAVGGYLNAKYAFAGAAAFGDFRDTNGDGLNDNTDRALGLDPYATDIDGDGVANLAERTAGTDPLRDDTDGDTVDDGTDAFPLDPTRTAAPTPSPGDVTPPVITLTKPANATPNP